jgi:anti-anti-sigma regulatory factor
MTTNKKSVKKKVRVSAKKARPTVKKKKVTKKKSRTVKNTPAKPAEKNRSTKPTTAKKESNLSLILDSVLVINDAKSLMQKINQLVESNDDISIDASAVEMIDTAILQLLLAATIKIRSSENKINWINPSDKFISNASLLGLTESLGIK